MNDKNSTYMNENKDFVIRTVIDYVNLSNIIKKQATQLEIMKSKNKELQMLVGFLKNKIIEYEPSMKSQFDALKI